MEIRVQTWYTHEKPSGPLHLESEMIQNLILLQIHMYRVFFGPLVVSTETENNLQKELHGRLADLQVD